MNRSSESERDPRSGERGQLMAGLAAATAILAVMSTIAFQQWAEMLRRDNEAEMIFRAQEIVRAIQRYRQEHGGQGPLQLELLLEPGTKGQYYIRQLYEDPLVPDGKWGLLYAGPGGQIIDPNAEDASESLLPGLGGGGLGNQQGQQGLQGQQGQAGNQSSLNVQGNQGIPQGGRPGQLGLSGGGQQGGTGLPIAGVRTLAEDTPYRIYNGLTEYSEWLFTYFDLERANAQGNQPGGQQPAGRPGANPGSRPGAGPNGRPGGRPGGRGGTPGARRPNGGSPPRN